VLYQAEGRSKGESGVAALGCPRCPWGRRVSGNRLYVAYDLRARMRLARSAIERRHGASLVITALLV
jgi:hypothetical protein